MKRLPALLLALVWVTEVCSQNPGINNNYSFGIGIGMSQMGYNGGLSLYFDFNGIRQKTDPENQKNQGAGFVYGARLLSLSIIGDEDVSGLRVSGGDLLIGFSVGKAVSFRLLTGVGITRDVRVYIAGFGNPPQPSWVEERFISLDLPIQAGLYLTTEYFGLGISGFVSYNYNHHFTGVNLMIVLGKFR